MNNLGCSRNSKILGILGFRTNWEICSNCNTQFSRGLLIQGTNWSLPKKRCSYSAVHVWDKVPVSIREVLALLILKKATKYRFDRGKPN